MNYAISKRPLSLSTDLSSRSAARTAQVGSRRYAPGWSSCKQTGVRPSSGAAALDKPPLSDISPALGFSYIAAPEDGRTPMPSGKSSGPKQTLVDTNRLEFYVTGGC